MEHEHKEEGSEPLPPIVISAVLPPPPKPAFNVQLQLQKTALLNRLNQDARDLTVPKSASAIALRPRKLTISSTLSTPLIPIHKIRRVKSDSELKHSWDYSRYINFNSKKYKDSPTSNNSSNTTSPAVPRAHPEEVVDSASAQSKLPPRPQHISLNLNTVTKTTAEEFSPVVLPRSGSSGALPDQKKKKSSWRKSLKKDKEKDKDPISQLPKVEEKDGGPASQPSLKASKSDFLRSKKKSTYRKSEVPAGRKKPIASRLTEAILSPHLDVEQKDSPRKYANEAEDLVYLNYHDERLMAAGSVDSLLKFMIETIQDTTFVKTFLLTHRHFMTSEDLLNKMIATYKLARDNPVKEKANFTQMRVVNVIKRWIQFSSAEFVRSPSLSAILKAFIVELNSGNDLDINFSGILYTTINEIAKDILGKPMTDAELADAPSPVLNRKVKSAAKQEARNLAFLDIDPKELARQMTLFDFTQFSKIRPWELLDNNFMKKETSPNIAFIADRFSQISRWIASELLTTPNSKQRSKIISQFITLGQRLVELQNFHTAHNIIAALSQTVVTNLKWDVSSSVMSKYATLEELFSPLGGFRHLRPIYESAKPPFVPPLNLLLKDLAMIEEGNPTYWKPPEEPDPNVSVPKSYDPEVKMINVLKIQMLGKIISNLQLAQEFKFVITPVPVIQEYLKSGLFCLSDQEFQNYKNRQKRISS
eukprot:TRINITY_DN12611_c0_g1_i1.p1 TRINITY_DN12611_c0_g1~~TRINITY_DN12611_c0_g1_i1.p1  ORF type:complete len:704 (+),score=95.42 TRINITY_DN12611_c0_g1_i1:599-2710(+)